MITRINRIKKHRVFSEFSWSSELQDFSRFNLIYGWNGSGKTTISNLFRNIEKRDAVREGEVEFHVDGKSLLGSALASATTLPVVRVFNRDYITTTVFTSQSSMNPIFFLGEHSVEKQKQIEALKETLDKETRQLASEQTSKSRFMDERDKFCIQQAKVVKELLSSSGVNRYNNYNKADFSNACRLQIRPEASSKLLSEEKKDSLKRQKDENPKDKITPVSVRLPKLEELTQLGKELSQKTVVSQVIEELAVDHELSRWVQDGLGHHHDEVDLPVCHFCGQTFPRERIEKLNAHFNDEYNSFLAQIDAYLNKIKAYEDELSALILPDKSQFYEHLSGQFVSARESLLTAINDAASYLGSLHNVLLGKRSKPFEATPVEAFFVNTPIPVSSDASDALTQIQDTIAQHNSETDNFQRTVTGARKQLEECLVAEALEDYKVKAGKIKNASDRVQTLSTSTKTLREQIGSLEREIVEHRRPAEELNGELRSYLGRDELRFEIKDAGYQITRSGVPASNFSEGERTAIAFLYFLKSLQDKGFNLSRDIIVIDDPVSSLDANSLFCAFGYMKERTKDAGQLFVLTHNFAFFRQVKNWFNHLPDQRKKDPTKRPARFFMLESTVDSGQACSRLRPLDPLLHRFESEYHYLFSKVQIASASEDPEAGLEEFYSLPNIARRLLEAFLAFRFPAQSGELKQQLEQVEFDPARRARILRFLHTYSHDGKISEPEHDLSILGETPQIMKDLLELMNTEDKKHCEQMMLLISPVPDEP